MDQRERIDGIMSQAMDSLKDMVDVNTVIGDPVVSSDGTSVIPISKVCFGFVAGGGDTACASAKSDAAQTSKPFAGGSAAGVSVQPVGFLVSSGGTTRVIPAQYYAPVDRIIEMVPQLISDIQTWIKDCKQQN